MLEISIAFVVLIAYGNLRGVRESGRVFAVPTYFFILNMIVLLGVGLWKLGFGSLPVEHFGITTGSLEIGHRRHRHLHGRHALRRAARVRVGRRRGHRGRGDLQRRARVPRAGVEERPHHARDHGLHARRDVPRAVGAGRARAPERRTRSGTPTVISQIGRLVYGPGALGQLLFYGLQAGTMLILVLAANTSFADFPRLASFHAEDNFMPRQLTKRGHRLVFSNGIIFLAVASIAVLIVTNAKVDRLIPLYAIGVFTSFTLSQAGMAKHHLTHREPHWRYGLVVNGIGAVLSLLVDVIIAHHQVHPRRLVHHRARPGHGRRPRPR